MVIAASIRARVLGIRLLDLDADIAVIPAAMEPGPRLAPGGGRRRSRRLAPANGQLIGAGLEEVTRSLRRGESELGEARRGMP